MLAVRMLLDRHLQLAHDQLVVPQGEVGLDAELHGGHPQLLQPVRLQPERLLVGQVAERSAAPQPECVTAES